MKACIRLVLPVALAAFVLGLTLLASNSARAQGPVGPQSTPEFLADRPGHMVIEGDMIVPVDYYSGTSRAPNAFYTTFTWPGGKIPYVYATSGITAVLAVSQTLMRAAMDEWESVANVRFVTRTNEAAFIIIQHYTPTAQNRADLGYSGGQRGVYINQWTSHWVMVHELGHTLGLRHEHNRPDRDQYVITYSMNVAAGLQDNFWTFADATAYGPYDFDSVMHYSECTFSAFNAATPPCPSATGVISGGITLRAKAPYQDKQKTMGRWTKLSYMDIAIVSQLYPYPDWRFVDGSAVVSGAGSSFFSPYKSFSAGAAAVPSGGTVVVQPGTYSGAAIYYKAQTWIAPIGGVILR